MKAQIVTCILLVAACGGMAQEQHSWEYYLNEVMTSDDAETATWEDAYEQLSELAQQPLDINRVTREQLEQLPFLSAQQIEGFIAYRDRYGPLKTMSELRMVSTLDDRRIRLLGCFFIIGEEEAEHFPTLERIARYGKHETMVYGRLPLYERKGDENGYLGYPYRHWWRYQFGYGDWVKAGVVGAQDAGEPFFANKNAWGYDYYSWYLQLRRLKRVEQLTIGQYRVALGMGLVINNNFSLGKLSMLQTLGRATTTIRPHSSRTDDYLRGAAATIDLGSDLQLTAFASHRRIDATLNTDGTAATIITTGYHRTETEMEKKHNTQLTTLGGSLRLNHQGFHGGLNVVLDHLDRRLQPNTSILYRRYYPQGSDFLNMSIDYGYASSRVALNGETAIDRKGHLATINSVSLRLGDQWNLMALQRFYSYRYTSLHAKAYSEGGRTQNESGLYIGASWQPSRRLALSAYADGSYFVWPRYQASLSSHALDLLVQARWQHDDWLLTARYRWHAKETDTTDKNGLQMNPDQRLRLTAAHDEDKGWNWHAQIDACLTSATTREQGVMTSGYAGYTTGRWRLNGGIAYFHTDSYASRLWLYEQAPLYNYSMSQFYGHGLRYWMMMRVDIARRLALTLKGGTTNYFDRSKIGSGLQEIDGSSQTDIDLEVRWKF